MRIGTFKVTREIVLNGEKGILGDIFQHVFPINIAWDYNGVGTYTAISEWFDDLKEGIAPLEYAFELTKHRDGTVTVECKKV